MMKLLLLLLIIATGFSQLSAQTECDCESDINALNEIIKKAPAYKVQFKKDEKGYDQKFSQIVQKSDAEMPIYDCFMLLNELLFVLNDHHNSIIATVDDSKKLKYNADIFPSYKGDLESLEMSLLEKPFDDLEGKYFSDESFSIGVIKRGKGEYYDVLILDPPNRKWKRGEVAGRLVPYGDKKLKFQLGNFSGKRFTSANEAYQNGFLMRTGFKKDTTKQMFYLPKMIDSTYLFKRVNDDFGYVKAGSFSGWHPILGEADEFYKSLPERLSMTNLILDLRNNGGGGNRNSNGLLKVLKKYIKKGNLYVLINHNTGSNAEQFAIKLQTLKNVILLGSPTQGAVAYEIGGDVSVLPSEIFMVSHTFKNHSNYNDYEGVGVKPDVDLEFDKDWIEQVLSIASEK